VEEDQENKTGQETRNLGKKQHNLVATSGTLYVPDANSYGLFKPEFPI
jgi:hypothetical protein